VELINRTDILWNPPSHVAPAEAGRCVCSFLDIATTSYGRGTHYNSRQEQQEAELMAHDNMLALSRDLYAVLMALPGVLDRSIQMGLKKLLSTSRNGVPHQFLNTIQERSVLHHMMQALPAQRMLKLIDALRIGNEEMRLKKVNNARTRKLILSTLLNSPRLELWSVKYRTKVRRALIHAWGCRRASIVRSILGKSPSRWTLKEKGILEKSVYRYSTGNNFDTACECIKFVFGCKRKPKLPLFVAFAGAKKDLKKGKGLPPEVLEGIRSTYHGNVPKEEIIKLTKESMTNVQKLQVQKRAKAAKVDVKIDPLNYDAVRLYLYAFECGLTKEIERALNEKAGKAAKMFPAKYEKIAVIVDMSKSMEGSKEQPLRPAAIALATRDMMAHVSHHAVFSYVGGFYCDAEQSPIRPMGDTALADRLIGVLRDEPEAVFVISDGYENAPAGRFAEVLSHVREAGIDTPVYHLNPVMAAESGGVRCISEQAHTMPLQSPTALGTTMIRGMIEADPIRGINALVNSALRSGPVFNVIVAPREG
jgi:hypothetical protein